MGCKPLTDAKTSMAHTKVSAADRERIDEMAERAGLRPSAYIRAVIVRALDREWVPPKRKAPAKKKAPAKG